MLYQTYLHCFLNTFQQPICSSTRAPVTTLIALCWGDIPAWSSRYTIKIHAWNKAWQAKIVTMSDLIKAQNTPQFDWYTCWTSLGANGMPDNLIEKGPKQPGCIKISFKKGAKEITRRCTWPGMIWHGVLPQVHAPWFQVKVFDLTLGYL